MDPMMSCVLTCYNKEKWIERALNSVLEQTRMPDEILIADDASTDNSLSIIRNIANTHTNIQIIEQKKNIGAVKNRDMALRMAKGDLITYLDADDWFARTKIENDIRLLKDNFKRVVFPSLIVVDLDEGEVDRVSVDEFCSLSLRDQWGWLVGRKRGIPTGAGIAMHKKFFEQAGGFMYNMKIYEDWEFQMRLLAYNAEFVSSKLFDYYYMRGHQSLSTCGLLENLQYKIKALRYAAKSNPPIGTFIKGLTHLFVVKAVRAALGLHRPHGFN